MWLIAMMLAPRWGFAQDITLNQSQSIALTPGTTRNFYDSGGSSSNYSTNESYTLTLTNAGNITINFSSFATESCSSCYDWDYMYIYDGTTSGTQLAKGQTGCSSANLTTGTNYTATSGTMTITWKSDGSTNAAGWVATITAASVPGLVPFVDGLESSTWTVVNGSCTNKWCLGAPGARYGTAGLYISNDSGTTNAYSTSSTSVVYAYKTVTFPSAGKYNLSFDIKQNGESTWDCVGAMLYDASTTPSASTSSAGSGLTSFPSGYTTMITGVGSSFSDNAWKTSSTDFTVNAAGQYKLTFCWKNDSGGGSNPPAAIDNVIVSKVNDVTAVTSPDGTGSMTASLTWGFEDGSYQGWTVINNDSDAYTWMISSEFPGYSTHSSATSISNESHNGPGSVISGSFINGIGAFTNVDNYLVSPRLILGGSISFYAKSVQGEYPEQFGVAVCTSDNPTASNFTTIQTWTGASDTNWHLYTVDLSAYTDYGYVAIRNYGTTDQYLMIVDDITLTSRSVSNFNRPLASGVSATFNVTPNSGVSFTQWTNNGATVSTSNSYTFTVQEPSALVAVMDVPATVPYTQDFESADHGWAMINGSCTNKWYCGAPGGKSGGNGLYISSDNGTNNTYNNGSSTYAYTYKSLTFSEAGEYILLFDLRQQGESTWDCVGAMLYSSSATPSPSTSYGSSGLNSWPSGYSQFIVGAGYDASGGNWAKISQTFTLSTAGTYKLVFGWKNDSGGGTNPPASIDNVIVKKIPTYYNVDASANPSSAGNVKFLVGDGGTTTNTYLPCYTLYNYNLTQQIYTPQEIGNVGTINSIAFYNGGDTKTLTDLEFYMVHTYKDEFGNNSDWISVTSSDLVFSGSNVEMTAGQWTIINLTTPFVYDGLSNLAIVTREHMQWSSGLGCRVFTPASGGYCSLYISRDSEAYDQTNPSQYSGTRLTVKNQILVNPGGSLTRSFPEGATVTLVEELTNSDYHFENWTDNSSNAGNNEFYTISNLAGAHTVVANFAPNTHTLTASVNPANSGTISDGNNNISGATTYNHGTSVTLTANAATGYTFQNWTIDGSTVSDASTTITMDQDHTVVANFTLNTYTVQVSASPSNGGTVSGGGTFNHGTSPTVTATEATGYHFVNWTEGGNPVSTNASYTITNISASHTLVANFEQNSYLIQATPNPSEGGTASGTGTYNHGATVTLTATANTGYTFTNWTKNGTQVSTNTTYTFNATETATYVANFNHDTYTLTYQYTGTVPSGAPAVPAQTTHYYNDQITAATVPTLTGYTFSGWSGEVSTMPAHDVTVTGYWTVNRYTIAVNSNWPAAGSATGGGEYDYGTNIQISATANPGYSFSRWSDGNTDNPRTVTVTGDHTYVAEFTHNQYTITLNPGQGGNASGGGTYYYGDECTVTALPNTGYSFVSWTENSSVVSTSVRYTFTVTSARTLAANFDLTPPSFTTTVNSVTDNSANMSGAVTYGGSITEYGFCWNTTGETPTTLVAGSYYRVGNGTPSGSFTQNITGLTSNTLYYVWSYVVSNSTVMCSDMQTSFTTLAQVTTASATNVTTYDATMGGSWATGGGATITGCGVVYGTGNTPTIGDGTSTQVTMASPSSPFTLQNSSNLLAETTYYVRAYVTNAGGTSYGAAVPFTTLGYYGIAYMVSPAASDGVITFNPAGDGQGQGTKDIPYGNDNSNNGAQFFPFASNVSKSFDEMLYPALTVDGNTVQGDIQSISFFVKTKATGAQNPNLNIYLMETSSTTLTSGVPVPVANLCYSGTVSTPSSGWVEITLDTPYAYQGGNLLVAVKYSGSGAYTWKSTDEDNRSLCFLDSELSDGYISGTGTGWTEQGFSHNQLPNAKFTIATASGNTEWCSYGYTTTASASTSNSDYVFDHWTVDGVDVTGNTPTYTFSTITANHTITANFVLTYKRFVTDGNWNVAGNWDPEGVPTLSDEIAIEANAIIPSGVIGYANNIRPITHANSSITIKDGGQLVHNNGSNNMVTVTVHRRRGQHQQGLRDRLLPRRQPDRWQQRHHRCVHWLAASLRLLPLRRLCRPAGMGPHGQQQCHQPA